jgi:L-xylulokinase
MFLPFVHGGAAGAPTGGAWVGLRGEHDRPAMLRAVVEGVAFSHRSHLDALGTRLPVAAPIRMGGGGTRSSGWSQLLCDVFGLAVEVTSSDEVSALGSAILAGTAVGAFDTLDDGVASTVRVARRHDPDASSRDLLGSRYARYLRLVRTLGELDDGP